MADKKIQIKHRNGETWDLLFPVTKSDYVILPDNETVETVLNGLSNDLINKVDKISGKTLTTNDFTTAEKTKLNSLKDHTSEISDLQTNKADKTVIYTRSEIDTKISNVKRMAIPVQSTAPTDSDLWYETL